MLPIICFGRQVSLYQDSPEQPEFVWLEKEFDDARGKNTQAV
jgi:hypothetical protein